MSEEDVKGKEDECGNESDCLLRSTLGSPERGINLKISRVCHVSPLTRINRMQLHVIP